MTGLMRSIFPGEKVARAALPRLEFGLFADEITAAVAAGCRISALFGLPIDGGVELVAVLADPASGDLRVAVSTVTDHFASLTPRIPQAHLFGREVAEQCRVTPVGHPWLKPVRFQPSLCGADEAAAAGQSIGIAEFFVVSGEEVHEVAVGPVHAGVIEPGHFRFQCHGERVLHLEISLGYQHRGIERALVAGDPRRALHLVETAAGDTTIGHSVAFCEVIESLSATTVPPRAEVIRAVALELERLANHVGDLGALAGDIAFLPTASFCGRLRGEILNLTALICGNRFGRSLVRPGGVAFDLEDDRRAEILTRLEAVMRDVRQAVEMMFESPSVQSRFEGTGALTPAQAVEIGLVGVAARACGLDRDARMEFPSGAYRFAQVPVSTADSGDVLGRALVRWLEIQRSATFMREQLEALPTGPVRAFPGVLAADAFAVSLVEGWRGEICHVAMTDGQGRLARAKIVDPSFHNWFGLALAMRDGAISDFPLCNKSFNLSYCGFDL